MVEYTKELIDKIVEDFKGRMASRGGSYGYPIVELGKILNSFLPVELPPCPVCGEPIHSECDDGYYVMVCWQCGTIGVNYDTEKQAIDAYLAIPYCVMYLERSKDAIH